MCCKQNLIDELDPTFLFVCAGTRRFDEVSYHCHEHIELTFILSGNGRYHVDGNYYDVCEGDILVFNPHMRHQSLVTSPSNPLTEFFVGFTDIQFTGHSRDFFPLYEDEIVVHTSGELRQKLTKLSTSMMTENSLYHVGRYFMQKSYLMQILVLLLRNQHEPISASFASPSDMTNKKYVAERIVSYFDDHYHEKISLDRIAENMYMSPFYISRIFKSEIGDSPISYLINFRLEKAKELLENGWEGSIKEVATEVGYDDAYHFSKLFKKKYGISPSEIKGT